MTTREIKTNICRICTAFCPILVELIDGRPVKVMGDPDTIYEGYICPKGRSLAERYNDPYRLLFSQKKKPDGTFAPISNGQAINEVARKLQDIIARHGPRSVAFYGVGGGVMSTFFGCTISASMAQAIGTPMYFSASAIDKPGEKISLSLHGNWPAGSYGFNVCDAYLIVGANPVIAKSNGAPVHNPGMRLKEAVKRGMKLIVIDPRKTETVKRAHIHLQARPGEDPAILAGMIHIVIAENLYDRAFIEENVDGFNSLKKAVAPFTPDYVAQRAGIPKEDLIEAAVTFARAKKSWACCSTGPSFSMHGSLAFYMALCLNTICGRWVRAGEKATYPNVLLPPVTPRAQPQAPVGAFGEQKMRVKGLSECAAGMPTAVLPDEILLKGEGQVKALICVGGNPMRSWPDTAKVKKALESLELMVKTDVLMTPSAEFADYVIASPMAFEAPGTSYMAETMKYLHAGRGQEVTFAQYCPAILEPPDGSDVIPEHEFLFRVAQKMGLTLKWANAYKNWKYEEYPMTTGEYDMTRVPTMDKLWEQLLCDSRIPFSEIKQHPHGKVFDVDVTVLPKDPCCTDKLQIADPLMMAELAEIRSESFEARVFNSQFPFQLVSRRENAVMNSDVVYLSDKSRVKTKNSLYVNPDDLAALGLQSGGLAVVCSMSGKVRAVVEADSTLRPGVVSLPHGFGGPGPEADPRVYGTNVNLLVSSDNEFDRFTGLPRMSAIQVSITPESPYAKPS